MTYVDPGTMCCSVGSLLGHQSSPVRGTVNSSAHELIALKNFNQIIVRINLTGLMLIKCYSPNYSYFISLEEQNSSLFKFP